MMEDRWAWGGRSEANDDLSYEGRTSCRLYNVSSACSQQHFHSIHFAVKGTLSIEKVKKIMLLTYRFNDFFWWFVYVMSLPYSSTLRKCMLWLHFANIRSITIHTFFGEIVKGKVGWGDGRFSLMHLPNSSRHLNRAQGSSFAFLMHSPNLNLHSFCGVKHIT